MKRVIVRFAGEPDPVVRRRAIQVGQSVRAGASKSFVFRGYIVTISGKAGFNMATAVELGVRFVALWGVAMIYEQTNSQAEQWRLPTSVRLKAGGGRLPPSQYDPELPADAQRTGFPRFNGRLNQAMFRDRAASRAVNRTASPARMDGPSAGFYAPAAKLESARYGVSHAWVGGTLAPFATGQNSIGVGPWLTRYRLLGASLQVTHWSPRGSWAIQVQDDWVSAKLGATLLFIGAAQRTDLTGEPWNHPWLRVGNTPTPRLLPDADEGGVGSQYAHIVTRESHLAYRQNCLPGIAYNGAEVLVAAPAFRLDDSLFTLHGSVAPDGVNTQTGYISARSLVYSAFYEVGAALITAAGHPELVLMKFAPTPVTPRENEDWFRYSVHAAPDVRYVQRTNRSRASFPLDAQGIPHPDGYPTVGSDAMDWVSGTRVRLSDLPAWFQPGTVAARSAMFRQAIGTWAMDTAPEAYIPLIDSDNPMPAVFGAVYTTLVGDEVEYAVAFKSLDNALVSIGASRRATQDQPTAPTEALLAVAKTGLVFVRTSIANPNAFTVTSSFHDVIGPADCAQFGAGMDPTVAFLPQVRYSCVLGTRRVYAVRAVRYERNPYLASALSMIGINVSMPYTTDYLGRENTSVGGPIFYTDREFGPYPDRAKYEELWFVIDGVKYPVDTRALGGNIEPITEGKYGNALLDPMRWFNTTVNAQRRQQLGMFSLADDSDYELLDFYADEFATAGMEMNTFAQVSDTDVMFVLHRRRFISPSRYYDAVVCRFSATTGTAQVVTTLLDDGNQQIGMFLALSCYQFEVKDAEGAVVQAPCLTLRRGKAEEIGQVLTSVDGGATWELLYDATSTLRRNSLGQEFARNGTPSMGLHALGRVGDSSSDPRYILRQPPAEG